LSPEEFEDRGLFQVRYAAIERLVNVDDAE
jgi:hypothetical protein